MGYESNGASEKFAPSGRATDVYPSNLAPIGAKLCQNAFRTIPNVLFFGTSKFFFDKMFGTTNLFFANLVWFSRNYGQTDLKIRLGMKFCFRCTYPEVCTIENHENHVELRSNSCRTQAELRSTPNGEKYLRRKTTLRCHCVHKTKQNKTKNEMKTK